jgi:hypothetical protein
MVRSCAAAIALFALTCSAYAAEALKFRDIDGRELPAASEAKATVVYFITNDCPISNQYAPAMNQICDDYAERGVQCYLAYVDPDLTREQIEQHRAAYSHSRPAMLDSRHELVERAGATVTPEAAVFDSQGELAYLGRINNFYAKLGSPRRVVTEHDLRDALDEMLAGKPVSNPKTQAVGCFVPTLDWKQQ